MVKKEAKKHYLIGFVIGISILLVYLLRDYLAAIFSGLILAFVFYPLFSKLSKKMDDRIAVALTVLVSIIVIIIPLIFVSSSLLIQSVDFYNNFDKNSIASFSEDVLGMVGLPSNIEGILMNDNIMNSLNDIIKSSISALTKMIPSAISSFSNFFLKVFVSFVVMIFALLDKGNFLKYLESMIPLSNGEIKKLRKEGKNVIRTVVYGMGLVAIIQGVVGGIGFWIFGINNVILWTIMMIILSLIPFLGAFFVWVPASIYLIASGDIFNGVGLAIYGLLIVSYVDNIARMKVFDSIGKVHPLITLFGIIIGLPLFGLVGLIVGPLILALVFIVIQIFHDENLFKNNN